MNIEYPNTIPVSAGYVINAPGHGAFDPSGRVAVEPAPDVVAAHNAEVSRKQVEHMRATGRGLLYLKLRGNLATQAEVTTWDGLHKWPATITRVSWHNMAGAKGRTDVDFQFDGSRWHGANIGDNDMVRCKRCKS